MPTHIHEMSHGQLLMAAERLRELLSPASWIKQDYCIVMDATQVSCFCLMGAVIASIYPGANLEDEAGQYERDAGQFVASAIEEFDVEQPCKAVIDWNDAPWRTWAEVDAVVDRIVAHYTTMSPGSVPVAAREGFV